LILLDYSHPWKFISTLLAWISSLSLHLSKNFSEFEILESKESFFKTWKFEKKASMTNSTSTSTADTGEDEEGSNQFIFEKGTLNLNFGIEILFVVTKSDFIEKLEKENEFHEEQFDWIQQSLRTIGLACEIICFL
jgi:dynein light intermediate chain 1, cytosolic